MRATPDWLLTVTGLGAGVAGSVITLYGTQTRERRQARAQSREAIREVQKPHRQPAQLHFHAVSAEDIATIVRRLHEPRRSLIFRRSSLCVSPSP